MQTFLEFNKTYASKENKFSRNPTIGWWLDNDPIILYHGTHERHLESILKTGIRAPTSGPTKNWVSLALEPNTAHGYAAMGGESGFRASGANAKTIPHSERIIFRIEIDKSHLLKVIAPERGAMQSTKGRLDNKETYTSFKKSDSEYYALTEVRYPKLVPAKFITGYGWLRK